MIVIIRIIILIFIVAVIKLIFYLFIEVEHKELNAMEELIDFIEYLRIYSCEIKLQLDDILDKYKFKNDDLMKISYELCKCIKLNENKNSRKTFLRNVKKTLLTPEEFNRILIQIADYYGQSSAEVLNMKLLQTQKEMTSFKNNFKSEVKERKCFINKISILLGILVAILLF